MILSEHFYLLVLNFNNGSMDVIDNRLLPSGVSFKAKYGNIPDEMVCINHFFKFFTAPFLNLNDIALSWLQLKLFTTFVYEMNPQCVHFMDNYTTRKIKVSWMDNENVYDCGIYMMKHMETYIGQRPSDWHLEFEPNNVNYK